MFEFDRFPYTGFSSEVRAHAHKSFLKKWVTRGWKLNGQLDLLIRPHMTFCLWGYIKNAVLKKRPQSIGELQAGIRHHFSVITSNILANLLKHFVEALHYGQDETKAQFEHFFKFTHSQNKHFCCNYFWHYTRNVW